MIRLYLGEIDPLANNFLANMATGPILVLFGLTIIAAFFTSYYFRNEYSVKKMLQTFAAISVGLLVVGLFLHIKIALILGILLAGLIVLGLRSNHYFYHK